MSDLRWSEEQIEAIRKSLNGNTYIAAGPGSGKSTTLAEIAKRLVHDGKKIILITFTNKSAKDIMQKVGDNDQVLGGTFHSIAYRLMKLSGLRFTICDESKKRLIIKKLFDCRKDKEKYEKVYESISNSKSTYPKHSDECTSLYDAELAKFNMLDFDDIIINGIDHIKDRLGTLEYDYILVDELQDTSQSQLVMLKELYKKGNFNIVGVGDDDQCQPAGSKVLTTNGDVDIAQLDENIHKIPSYVQRGSYVVGLKNGFKFQKESRKYTGPMYIININEKKTLCTYNHKWDVKWSKEAKSNIELNVVYLMRKDVNKFRIGWCQLFNKDRVFHLGIRARLESADDVWIIKVCNSKQEASMWESIYSSQYGIPTIPFKSNNGILYTQDTINNIFDKVNKHSYLPIKASYLLSSVNLDIEYPLWKRLDRYEKQGPEQIFEVQACNLNEELMIIPEYIGGKNIKWSNFIIKCNYVTNEIVYSLNIEPHHTYIVDGIVTKNSIYEWRGARPANVREFISHFGCEVTALGLNFRSKNNIVHHSRKLIEHNKSRIDKDLRAHDESRGIVGVYKSKDLFKEIDYVVARCKIMKGENITILYRNRMNKMRLEYELRKNNLSYRVNDSTEITDRSAFRVLLSMMRIAARIHDVYDLEEASKGMKALGKVTVDRIKSTIPQSSIFVLDEEIQKICEKDKRIKRGVSNVLKIQNAFDKLNGESLDKLVEELGKYIINSFTIPGEIYDFLLDITKEYHVAANDVRDICNDFGLDNNPDEVDENTRLELSTIHGYKGGERDIIIIPFCDWDMRPDSKVKNVVESERRLFYVAITRPKRELYLTYSGLLKPRFIKEMGL